MGKKDTGMYNNLLFVSQIGIMMTTPILGAIVIGNWVSEKMGGNKFIFFLFLILGVCSSFYELYRFSMKYVEKIKRK